MTRKLNIVYCKLIGIIFLSLVLIKCGDHKEDNAKVFLKKITDQSRFISPDQLAKKIIAEDPSIILIDVRSLYEFEEYSIPGAINIPSEEILKKEFAPYFDKNFQEVILFSNADIYADQAWVLLSQSDYKNMYILKGGLNNWFNTIMLPEQPEAGAPLSDFEMYSFRKGASLFFGGSTQQMPIAVEKEIPDISKQAGTSKKKVVLDKKIKKVEEGGC